MERPDHDLERSRNALDAAVAALLKRQDNDGRWRDYELPVGTSDEWVTAFVAFALANAATSLNQPAAFSAAERALSALMDDRTRSSGFGFNGSVDPDADSTATVVQLSRVLGVVPADDDIAFLLDHRRADGGFSTFKRDDCWGLSHPCVTPAVAMAFDDDQLEKLRPSILRYLSATRSNDGSWPSYWWTNSAYATWYVLQLLSRLKISAGDLNPVTEPYRFTLTTAMESLLALGISVTIGSREQRSELLSTALAQQGYDGLWPPSPTLVVTDWDCERPWDNPQGEIYEDVRGLFTTALAVRILLDVVSSLSRSTPPIGSG